MMQSQSPADLRNLIVAILLSTALLFGWQYFYEAPQKQKAAQQARIVKEQAKQDEIRVEQNVVPRTEQLTRTARVQIRSPRLHGSINLVGARLDDMTLVNYREALSQNSPEVILLSPSESKDAYFAQFGWTQSSAATPVLLPDENTQWQADRQELAPNSPVTLSWENGQGIIFRIRIALDEQYMFAVEQQVENHSGQEVILHPYALINRAHAPIPHPMYILHEGPLGVLEGTLKELSYKDLSEGEVENPLTVKNAKGWLGFSDKYWLTALVPDTAEPFEATFNFYKAGAQDRYSTGVQLPPVKVVAGENAAQTTRFFAGAKEIRMLDNYAEQYKIPLFDRAVDFGWFYFLTRPFLLMLTFINAHIGNFGIALMILTVIIKLAMYPLANKSYVAMNQMKQLQPEVMKLRERYAEDKMKMNQEMMNLYKRNKVNPVSGCLPILVQIPVFFALYKVLFVSIEMRHAPFYGWIHDLSAPDPTNLFTLFGLFDWGPPAFLHLGLWPILMTASMVIQQKMQPAPTDPMQAKMLGLMPYFFLFLFNSFPAGLVIYWTWSNSLSILQQWIISRRYKLKYVK